MDTMKWLKGLDKHDFNIILNLVEYMDKKNVVNEADALVKAESFVNGCLTRYGGSKEFAMLEYCSNMIQF